MTSGTRPASIGGPRHTSSHSRILSPGHTLSRSPDAMAFEGSPRLRSVTLPSNPSSLRPSQLPRSPWGQSQPSLRAWPRRGSVISRSFNGSSGLRDDFEDGLLPEMADRERRVDEIRSLGIDVEDSLMEEDIAWHMVLDALERDDIEMASEQHRVDRLGQVDHETTTHSASGREPGAVSSEAEGQVPSDSLGTSGQRDERNSPSTVAGATASADDSDDDIDFRDWDAECTTPSSPPLFSADIVHAAVASGSSPNTRHEGPLVASVGTRPTQPNHTIPNQNHLSASPTARSATPVFLDILPGFNQLIETTHNQQIDIAGICFDQSGSYMYVATTDSITEWKTKDSELHWWGGGGLL